MMPSAATITDPAPAPRVRIIAGLAAAVLCATLTAAGCTSSSAGGNTEATPARQAASRFLTAYARPDGRVVRTDQGGDTVSEGQAYGMLLAEATGDHAALSRIWGWTRDHLQLANGLFAFHANPAGQVVSREPASDADLLIAWALLRYRGPSAGAWHQDGRLVARAILAHEVTTGPGGVPVLTAGPWATGRPASLDPSYWSLAAFDGLAQLTADQVWHRLAAGAVTMTRELTRDGRLLPPDWAELTASGALRPEPAPDGSQPQTQYGPDAQRTVVWFAASCDPQARALAARWWPLLRSGDRSQALALRPDGTALDSSPAALPLVASAAAPGRPVTARRPGGYCSGRQTSNRDIRPTTAMPGPRSDRHCSAPAPLAAAEDQLHRLSAAPATAARPSPSWFTVSLALPSRCSGRSATFVHWLASDSDRTPPSGRARLGTTNGGIRNWWPR